MKAFTTTLLLLILLITGCSEPPGLSRLAEDAVILAFGDSLTRGNGARNEESYPAVLSALAGRKVINAGVSGEVSEDGLKRLPGLLQKHQPHLLILCHGGNDFLRKKDKRKLEHNLDTMVGLAREMGIEIILLGVPRPGLFLSSDEIYRKVAEKNQLVFIEDLVADVLGDNALKSDAVHPNREGYRRMAETVYETLRESGAI